MAGRKNTIVVAGTCILALVLIAILFTVSLYQDWAGHLATGSRTYAPAGPAVGKAIIVYSPGWTWLTGTAVSEVAGQLVDRGYEVEAAAVNSRPAQNLSGYDIVVLASPNYGKRPTDQARAFIERMQPDEGTTIGVLCTNLGPTTQGANKMTALAEGRGITVKATMIVAMFKPDESAGARFVSELLADENEM